MSSDNTTLMMLTPLTQSVEGFADTVSELNGIQSDFRSRMDQRQRQALFFGTEFEPGRIDNRFSDCLNALEMQTDDCIAFSILIGNRLADLGQKLAASYGKSAPGVVKASFEKAKDYIPEMSPYAAWVNTT